MGFESDFPAKTSCPTERLQAVASGKALFSLSREVGGGVIGVVKRDRLPLSPPPPSCPLSFTEALGWTHNCLFSSLSFAARSTSLLL